jgi:hypothetical protein
MMLKLGFIITEICYVVWGIFFIIIIPFMSYLALPHSYIAKVRLPFSIYSFVIGALYLVSVMLLSRRKAVGIKLTFLASILGFPFIVPIVMGLISLYYFSRQEIKEMFK